MKVTQRERSEQALLSTPYKSNCPDCSTQEVFTRRLSSYALAQGMSLCRNSTNHQVMQFLSGVIFLDTDKNRNVLRQVMPWTVLRVRIEAERRQV